MFHGPVISFFFREVYARYLQDCHQQVLHHQQQQQQALAQRPTSVEQKQYKLTGEKDPPKQPFAQKESAGNWPQHAQHAQHAHSKRPATPTSPLQRSVRIDVTLTSLK